MTANAVEMKNKLAEIKLIVFIRYVYYTSFSFPALSYHKGISKSI